MKHPYLTALNLLATSTSTIAIVLAATVAATVAANAHARHRHAVTLSHGALEATLPTKLNATNLKLKTTAATIKTTDRPEQTRDRSPSADLRPMMLQLTAPSGKILKPIAPDIVKSSQAKPKREGRDRPLSPLAQASQTVLLDRSGELTDSDEALESDNSRFDVYLIQGEANQTITIELSSGDFDPFLMLLDSDGQSIAQNDDISPTDTNSFLTTTLPSSGTYLVVVNGLDSTSLGSYRVTASVSSGAPVAPTVTSFTCNGYNSCTVTEGDSDYMTFSYTDANGNASEWTLNDFTAEIYPANGSGSIRPGIECTCPTGVGDCNAPATNTYTVAVRDTTNRVSNSRSVSVTCSP
jgi:Bacterial pre-peptidase C-terminal domain